jgi:hypothetical protein
MCVCVCVCACVRVCVPTLCTPAQTQTQYMAINSWTILVHMNKPPPPPSSLNRKLKIVNSKQLDQSGLGGPFRKLSPFAAMYMVYLLISHGMP